MPMEWQRRRRKVQLLNAVEASIRARSGLIFVCRDVIEWPWEILRTLGQRVPTCESKNLRTE
jgi:hypothetical protein